MTVWFEIKLSYRQETRLVSFFLAYASFGDSLLSLQT